jgi:hydroxypyruvate isomerase
MYPVVNLGLLFTELPWPERFAAAASAGFGRVEFPWPPLPPEEVVRRVRDAGVRVELMNMDAGDLAAGDRGYGNDPPLTPRWRLRLEQALELDCPLVNVLTGRLRPGPARGEQLSCLTGNLRRAAGLAAHRGRTLVVEPVNDRDVPGYLLPRVSDVLGLIDKVDHEAVALQLDVYHVAAMGDDLATAVAAARGGSATSRWSASPAATSPAAWTPCWPCWTRPGTRAASAWSTCRPSRRRRACAPSRRAIPC